MKDLAPTIVAKSDQLNAVDLVAGPLEIKITGVVVTEGDQPVAIRYEGDKGRPYKPSKGMRRVLVQAWGRDGEAYVGRRALLFYEPSVRWAGKAVGGIRIAALSDIPAAMSVAVQLSRDKRETINVNVLASSPIDSAHAAARQGVFALLKWKDDNPADFEAHIAGHPIQAELQQIAKQADAETEGNTG